MARRMMNHTGRRSTLATAMMAGCAGLATGSATAQEVTTLQRVTVNATAVDPEYVRSRSSAATKTDTPLLETPMAVQVIPGEVIADRQILTVQDAVKNVSGMQTPGGYFYDSYQIRGFSAGANTFRNGLKTYGVTGTEDMAFVDRVEVAKGPTAMLYGRVQPGGLVNIVTKAPQEVSAFSVQQQLGSWNSYRTSADATGALSQDKTLLYRLIGVYDKGDSFVDFSHHDNKALAAYLNWRPSTRFEANLQYEHYDNKVADRAAYAQMIPMIGSRPANVPRNWTQNDLVMWSNFPDTVRRDTAYFDWTYKFNDAWKLTQRFNYNAIDEVQNYLLAANFNAATNLYQRAIKSNPFLRENYSTNLDLAGDIKIGAVRHRLLFGLDRFRHWEDTFGYNSPYGLPSVPSINVFAPVYGNIDADTIQALINAGANNVLWRSQFRDNGAYAQDQISFGERWEVLVGGRYDWAKDRSSLVYGTTTAPCYPNCGGEFNPAYHDEKQFSPRAGVLYKVSNEVSLYGSYAKSFGSSKVAVSFSGDILPPERGEQFEIGAKASLLGGKVTSSLSLFDLYLANRQTPDLDHPGYSLAVGEVRSRGLEFDIAGQVTAHINLIASYTYDDATITKDNTAGAANTVGKTWAGVPLHNASLWAKYDTAPGAAEGLAFGLGVYLNGQRQANNNNTAQLPGFGRLDAMIAYRMKVGGNKLAAQLNANNLFDRSYFESGGSTAIYGAPRNLMASLKLDF
jgi:iron complex outermembrane recepter protein